jgi:hypothetical protein
MGLMSPHPFALQKGKLRPSHLLKVIQELAAEFGIDSGSLIPAGMFSASQAASPSTHLGDSFSGCGHRLQGSAYSMVPSVFRVLCHPPTLNSEHHHGCL